MFKTQYHQTNPIRVDKFLATFLTDVSREYVQDLIHNQLVLKNGIIVKKPKELVSRGDIIEVNTTQLKKQNFTSISQEEKTTLYNKVQVIFEHKDFLIIDKPAGLLVHKTNNPESYSLADIILKQYPEIRGVRDKYQSKEAELQERDGIVHRIDKDTSGIIVMARNQKAFEILKQLFQDRQVYKEYICLVRGHLRESHGNITYPIIRSKLDHTKRVAVVNTKQSGIKERTAHTEYWVEQEYSQGSLLRVVIHTGRTHQIRVHMKAIGHPIIGDILYGGKLEAQDTNPLSRQFLHAHKMSFTYKGEEYSFISDLPLDLQDILSKLR
jgi:23S rRNA pseudouridine1911/1915/1917 synthase